MRAVVRIWRELLGVPHVAPEDTFVGLGGNSLRLLRLLALLREEFELEFEVAELFQYPTAKALSDFIRHKRERA